MGKENINHLEKTIIKILLFWGLAFQICVCILKILFNNLMLYHKHLFQMSFYILLQHRFNGCIVVHYVGGASFAKSILHWISQVCLQVFAIIIN